jgi:hypothetical protein
MSAIIPEIEDPIVMNKTHSMLYMSLNTVAPFGMATGCSRNVSEYCNSSIGAIHRQYTCLYMTVAWKMYSNYVVAVYVWLGCSYVYFTSSSYLSSLTY